ncbi:DUF4142 domain-containing protein [Aurantimonas sp. 22II-16-19i]|uniref:DUF4142 domain-containing protein n=1 Tax=Aurantimonas sp. 22II-16-19i TaxID=1317114 RepID=UPI0009F7F0F2|nr:DUF4142 domain-containing protein [Aurantimonas sp. 22II-16-19i]ORE98824.1 hypothetical protein ATO4_00620 [Aurantimonas sp. 22II-16-19i]
MKTQFLTIAAIVALGLSAPAHAQTQAAPDGGAAMGESAMDTDKTAMPAPQNVKTATNFVPMAAVSNSFEIESSNLALTKSQNEDVRGFAEMMATDHSNAAMKMQQAVEESGTGLTVPTGLDARHQTMLDELSAADDSEFDAAYIAMQQKAHDEAVTLFTAYSQNGEDGPIKTFAANTLPTLKEHKQMVDAMK